MGESKFPVPSSQSLKRPTHRKAESLRRNQSVRQRDFEAMCVINYSGLLTPCFGEPIKPSVADAHK